VTFLSVEAMKAIQGRGSGKYQRAVVLDGPKDGGLWVSYSSTLERCVGAEFHGFARRTLDEFRGGYSECAGEGAGID